MGEIEITCQGERLILDPSRAIYWPAQSLLMLADLHIGKVHHFRRSGLAVPGMAGEQNLLRLKALLERYRPQRVVFLGDLFHSTPNGEWGQFHAWMQGYPDLSFELVPGNHEVQPMAQYESLGLKLRGEQSAEGPFLLCHMPREEPNDSYYALSGHVHPGVSMKGKGRQRLTLPCFFFGQRQAILPAFGVFTGLGRIAPRAGDQVYVIGDHQVLPVYGE